MEKIRGFARTMARKRVGQELNKPFIGKPHIKFGQCPGIWGYFFQLGGILAIQHRNKLDAFGHAFLGATGKPGAIENFFTMTVEELLSSSDLDSMTFSDYVSKDFAQRLNYSGDPIVFFLERGLEKMRPDQAEEYAWIYASRGAALGAIRPDRFRGMFERQNTVVPKENWDQARAAGLDLPAEQDVLSYEEIEFGEDGVFMDYCQQVCPELYAVLSA